MTNTAAEGGRTRYHHGDLRAALIEATLGLIEEKRAEEVSVADAARAVGVSGAAPYRHFRDREDLMAHVAAEGFRRLGAETRAASDAHAPGAIEGLIDSGVAYVAFGARHPELFHLMWGAARPEGAGEVALRAGEGCYGVFISTLSAIMQARGLAGRDPHAFGAPLWAMVHGFAALLIGRNEKLDRDMGAIRDRIDEATRAYFAGMAPGGGSGAATPG